MGVGLLSSHTMGFQIKPVTSLISPNPEKSSITVPIFLKAVEPPKDPPPNVRVWGLGVLGFWVSRIGCRVSFALPLSLCHLGLGLQNAGEGFGTLSRLNDWAWKAARLGQCRDCLVKRAFDCKVCRSILLLLQSCRMSFQGAAALSASKFRIAVRACGE